MGLADGIGRAQSAIELGDTPAYSGVGGEEANIV